MPEEVEILCTGKDGEKTLHFPRHVTEATVRDIISIDLREFLKLEKLEGLTISSQALDDIDLSPLGDHPTLVVFNMVNTTTKVSLDLSRLENCRNLQTLCIENYKCESSSGLDLSRLPALPELKGFSIYKSAIGNPDIQILSECISLERVEFGMSLHENLTFYPLSDLPHLKRVYVQGCTAETIDLAPLGTCPELEELVIFGVKGNGLRAIDLEPLSSCKNLRVLYLKDCSLKELDLSPLWACTKLQSMSFRKNQLQCLRTDSASDWPSLKTLYLSENQLQAISLDFLRRSVDLEWLDLDQNRLLEIDLSPLKQCTKLGNVLISGNKLKVVNLEPLCASEHLDYLRLDNNQLDEIDFESISRMRCLSRLDLQRNRLTTVDYDHLSKCRNLTKLDLSDNPIPYLELGWLVNVKNLKDVKAGISDGWTRVGPPPIKIPEGFDPKHTILVIPEDLSTGHEMYIDVNQESLKLSHTEFSLDFLSQMKNLKSLNLLGFAMNEEDIAKLSTCENLVSLSLDRLKLFSRPRSSIPLECLDLSFLSRMLNLESLSIVGIEGLKKLKTDDIARCRKLRNIELSLFDIQSIDITPLAECENLNTISIACKRIDLRRMMQLGSLKSFELTNSRIEEVVFESLSQCSNLESLSLESIACKDARVGLSHLSSLHNLSTLHLTIQDLEYLDVTPLMGLSVLKDFSSRNSRVTGDPFIQFANPVLAKRVHQFSPSSSAIREVVGSSGWQKVRSLVETAIHSQGRESADMWDQRALLALFGLEGLACLDGGMFELLDEVPPEAGYNEGVESLKQNLIHRLEEQVRSGGVCVFLDDEKLREEGLAELATLVRRRRTHEIDSLEIRLDATVDLKLLWITSIGFKVLRELEAGLDCSVFFLNEVEKKIGEYGLKLRTSDTSVSSSVRASEMMQQYIFDRARGHERRPSDTK